MSDYKTLVVPYDFSSHARAALYTAADLAPRLAPPAARIHLVHVIHLPTYAYAGVGGATPTVHHSVVQMREGAAASLRDLAESVQGVEVESHVVEGASVSEMLCETAEKLGADLIVMGTHGRTGIAHVFLGSVAERTLRHAPCPVLTVRGPEEEER